MQPVTTQGADQIKVLLLLLLLPTEQNEVIIMVAFTSPGPRGVDGCTKAQALRLAAELGEF
jgi:hypothetical protein